MILKEATTDKEKVILVPYNLKLLDEPHLQHFDLISNSFGCTSANGKKDYLEHLNSKHHLDCQTEMIRIDFKLQRKCTFELYATFLPSLLLTLVSCFMPTLAVFLADQSNLPFMLSFFALLIQTCFLRNHFLISLKITNYLKMIDIWVIFGTLISVASFAILSLKILPKDSSTNIRKILPVG